KAKHSDRSAMRRAGAVDTMVASHSGLTGGVGLSSMSIREPLERTPPSARQRAILALVRERRFAAVGQIAERFGGSEMTVRRDLRALEEMGLLERTHGGAVAGPDGAQPDEPPYVMRQGDNAEAKRRIARAA